MRSFVSHLLLALLLVGCADQGDAPDAGNPRDQCVGASDEAILTGTAVDGGQSVFTDGGLGISAALGDMIWMCAETVCGVEIVSGDTAAANECMRDCYASTDLADLTPGCQDCWTGWALCGADACPTACLGTNMDLCVSCMSENCVGLRDYCIGL